MFLTLLSLNIGTPKNINFPLNGKLMVLGIQVLQYLDMSVSQF